MTTKKNKTDDNSEMLKNSLKRLDNIAKIPSSDLVTRDHLRSTNSSQEMAMPFLSMMAKRHAEVIEDGRAIYDILTDLPIAEQTLVDNILSPTDLQRGNLTIGLDVEAPAECTEMIREHFSSDKGYNFNKKLPIFIKEALITIGSVPLLPLPPSAIRRVIQDNTYGLESINNNTLLHISPSRQLNLPLIGLIGNNESLSQSKNSSVISVALESTIDDMIGAVRKGENNDATETVESIVKGLSRIKNELKTDELLVEITDNPLYLAHGQLQGAVSEYNTKTITAHGWGMETDTQGVGPLKDYRDRSVKMMPFLEVLFNKDCVDTQDPIVLHLPSESVIPIINPATNEHIAYYVLIDVLTGHPLRMRNSLNRYRVLADKLDREVKSQATTVNFSFGVSYPGTNTLATTERSNSNILLAAYEERFERELKAVIKKGKGGMEVDIVKVPNVYRMMFARQLTKQATRVLYVPADRLAYLAYNYTEDGIGESLIEKTKLQSSFRAILKFAQVMAAVKSSINRSKLTINLDDKDPDPRGTVEIIRNETAGNMTDGFPVFKFQSADIIDSLLKAGVSTEVNGSNYPETKVELVESKREVTPPNSDIQDGLKEDHYQGWGLSLDLLEKANQIDFMGQIDNINLLQSKRMCGKQAITCDISADFMRKYLRCGGKFYNKLKECLETNKSKLTIDELIESLTVILPKADYAQHKAQATAYADYVTFITDALDAVLSDTEMAGLLKGDNVANDIPGVKIIILNELKRRYLKSRNILPEIFELIGDSDNTLQGILQSHISTNIELVKTLAVYIAKEEHKVDEKIQEVTDKLNPPEPEEDVVDDAGGDAEGAEDSTGGELDVGDAGEGLDDADLDDAGGDDDAEVPDEDSEAGDDNKEEDMEATEDSETDELEETDETTDPEDNEKTK